ncbi:MAG: hypothetical protein AB8B52_08330 [Winogradskyella sp.]|uniref:hypothetical protein n=1 Tax=Winogradskyella sp. TaxID=1883156 RepID=UPI00385EF0F7
MKTILKNILVLAVMLGTYTSYATTTVEKIPTVSKVSKGDYISVSDALGKVVYSGYANYNGNLKNLYDFSQLKNGVYTVEINKDFEIKINAVAVKNNQVTFIEDANQTIYKPVFRSKNARVIISKLALDTTEMVVELYYEGESIHTETVKGNDVLNRVYKLDTSLKGEYQAVITTNNRVFVENFRI